MQQIILILHVLIAISLIVLVLIQQGKGAQMGAAFGTGASQTLFGSQGSGSFLLKVTGILAILFFTSSLVLGFIASRQTHVDPLQGLSNAVVNQAPAAANGAAPQNQTSTPNAGVPIPAGEMQSVPSLPAQPSSGNQGK